MYLLKKNCRRRIKGGRRETGKASGNYFCSPEQCKVSLGEKGDSVTLGRTLKFTYRMPFFYLFINCPANSLRFIPEKLPEVMISSTL